ncbi:MAG: metallophosphoesterase [Desulfopila sp.]
MRIIAFGDVHMAANRCRRIPDSTTADLVIVTGDLTNFGHRAEGRKVIDELMAVNPRLLAVIGNLDHHEIDSYLDQLEINLHGRARIVAGPLCIIGLGGSNITPFATPTEFSETELARILTAAHRQAEELRAKRPDGEKKMPTILVSHVPPRDTRVDRLRSGRGVGSLAVRRFIETHQPEICLTGHIHEARGEDWLGATHVLNPGMFVQGGWVEMTLNHSILTATLK